MLTPDNVRKLIPPQVLQKMEETFARRQKQAAARARVRGSSAFRNNGKISLTLSREKWERAERASKSLTGKPLDSLIRDVIQAWAQAADDMRISEDKGDRKKEYIFASEADRIIETQLTEMIETNAHDYPEGFTMTDLFHLYDMESLGGGTRSDAIMFGRIMRNLGYRKVRIRIPATDDAPAKLGWVYRKEDSEPWLPPAA